MKPLYAGPYCVVSGGKNCSVVDVGGKQEIVSVPGPCSGITGDAAGSRVTVQAALFFFSSSAALRPTLEGGHVAGGKSVKTPGRNLPTSKSA